ncbi:MAG TPA: NifU family protein [Polyangiaceae bacterium LLY-WYZ-15_(1-7)]|nr:NifU family protein [Polyangiaceae bacterium LLY-WYZ-15_(1-7)]HJL12018.1 NifU family protein [Polyangiaceae bacterium LLY-WYZ-15_(1-7)]HJL26203.1 NifU family protein [Polyangiaceae bacterium LLY-WYZ-15_(1-7)]HJL27772.1 NifU family protein [Polyangiaceae bacterium LLY-WYZ-15_(1-7)]HJL34055.1 NifU family protein [Polyangiaceae bacterium LLY-WYZ-15_(1-7)]
MDRDAIEAMVEDVLRPLIQRDGGDLELVAMDDGKVVVRLSGEAAFGAGAHYVRTHVVEAGLREAAGDAVEIEIEKAVPKAARR